MSFANLNPKGHVKYFAPCCYSTVSLTKDWRSKLSCLWWYVFFGNSQNGMLEWVHDSQSNSNDDLWRFWVSQWLLMFQAVSICSASIQGAGHTGRAKRYVPEPGWRRQVSTDAKRKVVDFSALQCVAGVILVNLVPGENASFVLWSCWTRVKCVKPYFLRPTEWMSSLTLSSFYFLNLLAGLFFMKLVFR